MAWARSLEDALKRRSTVGAVEAHGELTISLENLKTSLLEFTAGRASASSLQKVWANRAERICRDMLDRVVHSWRNGGGKPGRRPAGAIEGFPQQDCRACPVSQGFELEHSKIKLEGISKELADSKARGAHLLHKLNNEQTLPGIMSQMPPGDWKKWARERSLWIQDNK
jgi:hypothetical protein